MKKTSLNKITPNKYYANLLKECYAGTNGETNCILQFLYFSYILSSFENEFNSVLYEIAQDEIDHHSMLGECIVKLGGDPNYCSPKGLVFNGKNIEEVKGIKQILSLSIELKEKTIINYKVILTKVMEKEIRNILEIIISDEQKHKEILEKMLKKYENN